MSKDLINFLGWRFNYYSTEDTSAWLKEVKDYISHLESTISQVEGTLELSGAEPQEVDHGTVVVTTLEYIRNQSKYKSSIQSDRSTFEVDMEKRLLELGEGL